MCEIEELRRENEKLKEENKNLSELLELFKEIVMESLKRPNRFNDILKDKRNLDDDENAFSPEKVKV